MFARLKIKNKTAVGNQIPIYTWVKCISENGEIKDVSPVLVGWFSSTIQKCSIMRSLLMSFLRSDACFQNDDFTCNDK